jgi:Terminase large subunit, T4likevirus-type, N-terminal
MRMASDESMSKTTIRRDKLGRFPKGQSGNPNGRPARGSRGGPDAEAAASPEYNRLAFYRPYPKQMEFHAAGAEYDERLLMAGNQLGKTLAGGMEWAMHLTGRYPDWWKGRVFPGPVRMWASGVTAESTRDNPQRILLGQPQQRERWGSGTIPRDALKDTVPGHWGRDAVDSAVVRWGGGGDVQQGGEHSRVQVLREGPPEMAGRDARRGLVR